MTIDNFKGEYGFLSNFQPCKITYKGIKYSSAEAAYQAQKCPGREEEFAALPAGGAKKLGRSVAMRPDWEDIKLYIMLEVVDAKFRQNPELMEMLVKTAPHVLVEGNTWYDYYWGVCNGYGENYLGKILMYLRDKYLDEYFFF